MGTFKKGIQGHYEGKSTISNLMLIFFKIIFSILNFVLIFLKNTFIIYNILDGNSKSNDKYLDSVSALGMGLDLEDINRYNSGLPIRDRKKREKLPYIQKTKYF